MTERINKMSFHTNTIKDKIYVIANTGR